jgi:hypothetical protein
MFGSGEGIIMSDLLKKMDENSKLLREKPFAFSLNHCGVPCVLTLEQVKLLDERIPDAFVKKMVRKEKDAKGQWHDVVLDYISHGFVESILDATFGKLGWGLLIYEYPKDPPSWESLKVRIGDQEYLTKNFSVHVSGALKLKVNGEWITTSMSFGSQTAHIIEKDGKISFAMTWGDMLKAACSDLLKRLANVYLGIGRSLALERGGTRINIQQQYPLQHPPVDETEDDVILRVKTMEMVLSLGEDAQNVIKARMKAVTPEGMVPYVWQTLPINMVRSMYEKLSKKNGE